MQNYYLAYGKLIQNPRKYTNTKLVDGKRLKAYTKKSNCLRYTEHKGVVEVQMKPKTIREDYPIHVGNTVLHLSKLIMLKYVLFLYEYLEKDSFSLIYTGKIIHICLAYITKLNL